VNQRNLAGVSPLMAAAFNGDVQIGRGGWPQRDTGFQYGQRSAS